MHLIPDWRQAWRWFSVQFLAIIMVVPLVWASLPADAKAFLPDAWEPWVLTTLAACGILGRIIDQKK
jgi:hypothetical protein